MTMSREQLESDLEFVGFIIFKNNLKPESKQVIQARFDKKNELSSFLRWNSAQLSIKLDVGD